jgi:hypothetical protein
VPSACSKTSLATARGNAKTEAFSDARSRGRTVQGFDGKARVSGIDGQPMQVKDELAIFTVLRILLAVASRAIFSSGRKLTLS